MSDLKVGALTRAGAKIAEVHKDGVGDKVTHLTIKCVNCGKTRKIKIQDAFQVSKCETCAKSRSSKNGKAKSKAAGKAKGKSSSKAKSKKTKATGKAKAGTKGKGKKKSTGGKKKVTAGDDDIPY